MTRPTRLEASGYFPEAIPFVWRRCARFTWTWPTSSEHRAFAGYLVHNHGAPNHHKALNQASDYFHDVYGGTMVHLFGLKPGLLCCGIEDKMFSANLSGRAQSSVTHSETVVCEH